MNGPQFFAAKVHSVHLITWFAILARMGISGHAHCPSSKYPRREQRQCRHSPQKHLAGENMARKKQPARKPNRESTRNLQGTSSDVGNYESNWNREGAR